MRTCVVWYFAGMKFARFVEPNSLDLLNLRAKIKAGGCGRCHCLSAVVVHGYLWGYAASGDDKVTRGMRFLCSDRYSNHGCGGTFSVYWDTVIPRCSLRTAQLLELMRVIATGPTTHGAWHSSRLKTPVSSVYRWVAKWRNLTAQIRTRLCLVVAPPGKTDGQPDPFTLHHLTAAFPQAACAIAAFQSGLQTAITG